MKANFNARTGWDEMVKTGMYRGAPCALRDQLSTPHTTFFTAAKKPGRSAWAASSLSAASGGGSEGGRVSKRAGMTGICNAKNRADCRLG